MEYCTKYSICTQQPSKSQVSINGSYCTTIVVVSKEIEKKRKGIILTITTLQYSNLSS